MSGLPTDGEPSTPIEADGIRTRGQTEVFRVSTADLTQYGDATYASTLPVDVETNVTRGEGAALAFQQGRPLFFKFDSPVLMTRVIDFTLDDNLAKKLFQTGRVLVEKQVTNPLEITLPSLSQFLDNKFRLGDSGTFYIGVQDTSGSGPQLFELIDEPSQRHWGDRRHITDSGAGNHLAACVVNWSIDLDPFLSTLVLQMIPSWSGQS